MPRKSGGKRSLIEVSSTGLGRAGRVSFLSVEQSEVGDPAEHRIAFCETHVPTLFAILGQMPCIFLAIAEDLNGLTGLYTCNLTSNPRFSISRESSDIFATEAAYKRFRTHSG